MAPHTNEREESHVCTTPLPGQEIEDAVARLVVEANRVLPSDVIQALEAARAREPEGSGARMIFDVLVENAAIAPALGLPCCQDTGIDVVLVRAGQGVTLPADLQAHVDRGIAKGTREGYLRNSVCDPLTRKNTGDNTPAVVHVEFDPSVDGLTITLLPKGCGSENMSALRMLPPSAGLAGVEEFVISVVEAAGPNPCPPGIVGVGIGGTMETACLLAKKALARPCGTRSPRPDVAEIESRLLGSINALGIGPQGLGGRTTVLSVAVETYPCHIASLPVAVNIQCHAARRAEARWRRGSWSFSAGPEVEPERGSGIDWSSVRGMRRIELPFSKEELSGLRAGDWVLLNGKVLTGRDATHRVMVEMLERGEPLPVSIRDRLIYYVGPSPAPPGCAVGAAGPTTSYRMDAYTPALLAQGVKAVMGKGRRSQQVKDALVEHGAVYLATIGGAGAFLSQAIESARVMAFPELGPEALYEMELKDFPAVVINDTKGGDHYENLRS